ncbi:MAG: helix-turn-helix domain-containing protein [Planctomycetes bacterium]|nr:helix-turn-helix domain-containing protein [Planctomycetota bacterium]
MDLSLREAAALLGRNPRTLRAQLARGEIAGRKSGKHWLVPRHSLPLTEAQRRTLQVRADELRAAVDEALPSRTATDRGPRRRSVADLDCFRAAQRVLRDMRAQAPGDASATSDLARAREQVEAGLLHLSEASHLYHPRLKLRATRHAHSAFARAVGLLFLEVDAAPAPPRLAWIVALESEVLPAVGGLMRWSERSSRRPR